MAVTAFFDWIFGWIYLMDDIADQVAFLFDQGDLLGDIRLVYFA